MGIHMVLLEWRTFRCFGVGWRDVCWIDIGVSPRSTPSRKLSGSGRLLECSLIGMPATS